MREIYGRTDIFRVAGYLGDCLGWTYPKWLFFLNLDEFLAVRSSKSLDFFEFG